ncbi:MAG: HD domain-containing protein [Gammaproteobacteria bacterium]|nr:HD domain-containing protein [Gammaproteobacteria bacterium]
MISKRFSDAVTIVNAMHAGHQRKGTEIPYLSHLLAVASLVLKDGGDEVEAIAGLFHDAVEDQGGLPTLGFIRGSFGDRVADIVLACTDATVSPKPPWEQRKRAYIEHLKTRPEDVLRVSNADKLHNLRCIASDYATVGETLWERFSASREQTLWYYRELSSIFTTRRPDSFLGRDLASTLKAIEISTENLSRKL